MIFSCMLCQLANYSHSVISLVNKGLDTPARALLRSTSDLSYMLSVLSNDRETLQEYVLNDEIKPKELWYKLFSNKKIASKISAIHNELRIPEGLTKSFRSFREENNEFYSEAVHHSPTAILIGSLPRKMDKDIVELAVLGGSPKASGKTLSYLILSVNYGLNMFLNSKFNSSEFSHFEQWESGKDIFDKAQLLFIEWFRSQKHG